MCSILGIFDLKTDPETLRETALQLSRLLRHRGPDWSGVYADEGAILAHERLAIVDPAGGAQPLIGPAGKHVLAVNGEIYNHQELRCGLESDFAFKTASDCEVILALYAEQKGNDFGEFLNKLNGIFAFALWDAERGRYLIARDPIGVIPLYNGWDEDGNFYVSSEMKALVGTCRTIADFPPGHYLDSEVGEPVRYYDPEWRSYDAVQGGEYDPAVLRKALEGAVHRQLMCDVPYGVLLSGGLDSSLTSAIARLYSEKRVESGDQERAWWPQLHSFAIGLEGSPDLAAAQKVADAIGTVHHPIVYTVQEGLDALRDVIYHIESFDVTSIRASTPMYLMARRIKAMGIKMVLTGEGADEIFGGYLYFHKAPNAREFHEENVRKIDLLHKYDCLRANKSMAAWGIEARVPFLDREFLDVAMSIDAEHKMSQGGKMEKHILRESFDGSLPDEVLWRQKEQFSDGVGYSWIDSLKDLAEREVSDDSLARAKFRFPQSTPTTKEGYFYRTIFEEHFPSESAVACVDHGPSIACSTPKVMEWEESFKNMADPSGRAIRGVHQDSY